MILRPGLLWTMLVLKLCLTVDQDRPYQSLAQDYGSYQVKLRSEMCWTFRQDWLCAVVAKLGCDYGSPVRQGQVCL